MNPKAILVRLAALCLITAAAEARPSPLATAFTYQGSLSLGGTPVNGSADLQFTLWDAASGPTQVGAMYLVSPVSVSNGQFTVQIDFGAVAFNGDARWLQIAARSPAGGGAFTTLTPRQPITAVPYALQTRGMFVDASGRVGIGTTVPGNLFSNAKLDVAGGHIVVSNDFGFFSKSATGIGAGMDTTPTNDLLLFANGAERARLTAAGDFGIGTATPGKKLTVAGDMEVGTSSGDYRHLRIGGGNSDGFLYGSYPHFGDGIHLGYNYYANSAGTNQIVHSDGGTSRISTGYGFIALATAPPFGGEPLNRLTVDQDGNVGLYRNGGLPLAGLFPDPPAGSATFPFGTPTLSAGALTLYGPAGNTRFGVRSRATSGSSFPNQAEMFLDAPNGTRVISLACAGGESTTPGTSGTIICTHLLATVSKNFLVPNPDNPREDLTYACLEGPECGMYLRGTASLIAGRARVYLPTTFSSLASKEGLTVILTPLSGDSLGLACVDRSISGFDVVELMQGRGDYDFDWEVKAVRRGTRTFQVVHPWTDYARGDGTTDDLWQRRMADLEQRNASFEQEDRELGPRP